MAGGPYEANSIAMRQYELLAKGNFASRYNPTVNHGAMWIAQWPGTGMRWLLWILKKSNLNVGMREIYWICHWYSDYCNLLPRDLAIISQTPIVYVPYKFFNIIVRSAIYNCIDSNEQQHRTNWSSNNIDNSSKISMISSTFLYYTLSTTAITQTHSTNELSRIIL